MRASIRMTLLTGALLVASATSWAAPIGPMSPAPAVDANIIQVQSWSCRACRRDCAVERRYCGYGDRCQNRFVGCMRSCWENVCRR